MHFDQNYSKSNYMDAIRADFTRRAPDYDQGSNGQMHKDIIERLLNTYPPQYPVLDIACGTGLLSAMVGRNGTGTTGLDHTPAMLDQARRNAPEATFVQGAAEALPFENESFSSVYICSALVYFTDIGACLSEAKRVLRNGGFVAYQAVTLDSYVLGVALASALERRFGRIEGARYFKLPHAVTDGRIDNEKLLQMAGFVDVVAQTHTVHSTISIETAEQWWNGATVSCNAMMQRLKLLTDADREVVRLEFLKFLEERRDVNDMIADKVTSWYVKGTKGGG